MPESPPKKKQPSPAGFTRLAWWAWVGYWLLLFAVTHLPKPPGAFLAERIGDKLVHAGAYYVLAILGGWAAWRKGQPINRRWALRWLIVYAVYAAFDEVLQQFVDRACQFTDWLADLVGVTLALLFLLAMFSRTNPRPSAEP